MTDNKRRNRYTIKKYAKSFIEKLKNENRRSFTLDEIINFLPESNVRDVLALHVASKVIQELSTDKKKIELRFFKKVV